MNTDDSRMVVACYGPVWKASNSTADQHVDLDNHLTVFRRKFYPPPSTNVPSSFGQPTIHPPALSLDYRYHFIYTAHLEYGDLTVKYDCTYHTSSNDLSDPLEAIFSKFEPAESNATYPNANEEGCIIMEEDIEFIFVEAKEDNDFEIPQNLD
jgi:hypothetical protein